MRNIQRLTLAIVVAAVLAACGGGGGGAPALVPTQDIDYQPSVIVHVGGEENILPGSAVTLTVPA
ncbi:hypothetical protein IIA16_03850 [bacterium]|nr:hypothetical protein [bacterium]